MRRKKDIRIPGKKESNTKGVKSLSAFWIGIVCSLPLLKGMANPYWISFPPIGEVMQWWPLNLIAQLYPLLAAIVIWINAKFYFQQEQLSTRKLIFSIRILGLLFLASFAFFAIKLFLLWYDNPVGKYLLWSPNSYYLIKLWEYARPYVYHLGAGVIFGVAFYILYLLTQGRVMERNEALLGILIGSLYGIQRTLYIVIAAFVLTVLWMVFQKLRKKELVALRVTPALFIASYLILFLPTK